MGINLDPNNGYLSLTIDKEKKTAIIHIEYSKDEITYELTPEQAEQLGTSLLKTYSYFAGKGSFITIYSGKNE